MSVIQWFMLKGLQMSNVRSARMLCIWFKRNGVKDMFGNAGKREGMCIMLEGLYERIAGKHILKIEGLPADTKRSDIEHYLESVTDFGAKIYFLQAENMKIIDENSDFIVSSSKHLVLAVFDTDTTAQNALLNIKTTKFQLFHWHCSQECKNVKKS
ncbi:uncharacterized protein TNCV_2988661 [Trichonephila clavipes]|nr:uncharacterized protein TNCV_2988661 [Trichonephila clavipes]